jgi:predicted N-formylglutamate amidohydrolase
MIDNFLSLGGSPFMTGGAGGARQMLRSEENRAAFLGPRDPAPVEIVNRNGGSPFVLSCEHAGRLIPAVLGDLGVPLADMDRHIAYDVGAEPVARKLAALLDAPLVLQRYSRLVIDCNRPFGAPDLTPPVSDGTPIPVNADLTEADKRIRFDAIHAPFHDTLSAHFDERAATGKPTIFVTVHSFTPRLVGGPDRPWHLTALSNRDPSFSLLLLSVFAAQNPGIVTSHNEPYIVDDSHDYTIPVHGERRGLPHTLLEIRNDLLGDDAGQTRWASLIAAALSEALQHQRLPE